MSKIIKKQPMFQFATIADAANAASLAMVYQPLAAHLATELATVAARGDTLKAERTSVWAEFKSAIGLAQEHGHTPKAMRTGLEIACIEAGIPAGSFRGYVSTVENLAVDLAEGNLERSEVETITVADARARYFTDEKKALVAAREALTAATKGWNAENIRQLADLAATIAAPVVKEVKQKKAA